MKKFSRLLLDLAAADERIYVIDNDLSRSSGTDAVARHHPDRFVDVGVAEQNSMGIAAGLALMGRVPVVHTFATFGSMRACEQVRSAIAYQNLRVLICLSRGGLASASSGPTHHGMEDLAIMRAMPNMRVVAPRNFSDLARAIDQAVREDGPTYLRVPPENVSETELGVELGRGVTLRTGHDVTIAFTGALSEPVEAIVDALEKEHVSVRLLYFHTLKPLDVDLLLQAAEETAGIVSIEEHNIIGGLGSAIAEALAEARPTRMLRVGIEDVFCCEAGTHADMLEKYCLSLARVRARVATLLCERENPGFPPAGADREPADRRRFAATGATTRTQSAAGPSRSTAEELERLALRYPVLQDFHAREVAGLSERALAVAPCTGLVVITPDGLAQGVHRAVLARHGSAVRRYRLRHLDPAQAELLYLDGLTTTETGRRIDSWWIKRATFDFGDCLGLLLVDEGTHGLCRWLTEEKGASDPLLSAPGTLRSLFRAPNKTFGLLHTSDDMLAMLYEASLFFECDDLERLLTSPDEWIARKVPALEDLGGTDGSSRIEDLRVLYDLKTRLLLRCLGDPRWPRTVVDHCLTLARLYADARGIVRRSAGFREERLAISRILDEEERVLTALREVAGDPPRSSELARLLVHLESFTRESRFHETDFRSLWIALEADGVVLPERERTILESALFFHRML